MVIRKRTKRKANFQVSDFVKVDKGAVRAIGQLLKDFIGYRDRSHNIFSRLKKRRFSGVILPHETKGYEPLEK